MLLNDKSNLCLGQNVLIETMYTLRQSKCLTTMSLNDKTELNVTIGLGFHKRGLIAGMGSQGAPSRIISQLAASLPGKCLSMIWNKEKLNKSEK